VAPSAVRYQDRVFEHVDVERDVRYGRATGADGTEVDLYLDLFQPAGDTAAARPAIVYAHGGYFVYGSRTEGARVADELARRGYVVVSISYRLFPGADRDPAQLARALPAARHDAQAAVRWLRANAGRYRIAPDAIGAMGYSAGAVTALGVAGHADDPGDSGNPGLPSGIAGAVSLAGVNVRVGPDMPPVLMIHGAEDTVVPYASAVASCDAINAAGRSCELVSYPGLAHDIYARYDDWIERTAGFFAATVVPVMAGRPADPPAPAPVPPTTAPDRPRLGTGATATAPVPVRTTPRYTG
jgi:acetyl esterase/lipase